MSGPSRRAFLQTTAALTAAATFKPSAAAPAATPPAALPYPENGILIPDDGWRLWLDRDAPWTQDDIHLPEEIHMSADGVLEANGKPLPVNAPTGGWSALTPTTGKAILLPTSVEQHFWGSGSGPDSAGEPGTPRPYLPTEYRYADLTAKANPNEINAADDSVPINGAYFGVSWWHRPISIPANMRGKRIFLHIRGAHLRAEVYLNGRLCGYSIMEELPFEADLTRAAHPGGSNHLAIRITNPFGRYDWVDGLNAKWGKVSLYRSHGFGALDRGMTISAHAGDRIADAWIWNLNEAGNANVQCCLQITPSPEVKNTFVSGSLSFQVIDPHTGKVIHEAQSPKAALGKSVLTNPRSNGRWTMSFLYEADPGTQLWDLENPKLYHMKLAWLDGSGHTDTRTIAFGFRTFAPSGVGTNGMFRLNGHRIKLYSSISWGFWGLNGMFPVPELAEKEVTQAKKLNLNCLNFHRNLAKEDVLRAQDQLGLLRFLEPGAGRFAIGKLPAGAAANSAGIVMQQPASEAERFARRFMFVKCVEMVKAFRSHPSVIIYCLQNEIGADLANPDTLAILKAMHDEDPSRIVVLNDGFVAPPRKAAQAWYEPWGPDGSPGKLHRSDQEEWGAWWNQHQGAGDQWYDEFYKSPTDFTYMSPERKPLSEFGEMEGCATPDNHSLMLHQQITAPLAKYGAGLSYDRRDHQEIETATSAWLRKWNFLKAFPATEDLWNALGKKCYDTWQNYLENARISDDLDFAVISGWESTAMENHSGIVDNLRNFKSDPGPIRRALQPVTAIAKQRSTVVALGQPATFDLFLLNDTGVPVTTPLNFFVLTPSGRKVDLKSFRPPTLVADQFSYLLQQGFSTSPLTEEGLYSFRFTSDASPLSTQVKDIWVTAVSSAHTLCRTGTRVGVSGISPALRAHLVAVGGAGCYTLSDFKPGERYDLIISAGLTSSATGTGPEAGETTGLEALPPTAAANGRKLEPGEAPEVTQLGRLDPAILDAVRAGTPLLCIPQANTLSDGCAKQLAQAGAFTFHGNVGDFRAPWMGNWYLVREHPLYAGMPVNQAMGIFYQAKGRQSNGLIVDRAPSGGEVDIIVGYSRDHDRRLGAGTFTTSLGKGKIVYHRCPDFHPVLQQRFLANALRYLTT